MMKTRKISKLVKEPNQKGEKQIVDDNAQDGCLCNNLSLIFEKLQSVSDKLVAESLYDSYDTFSKYISSLLRGLPKKEALKLETKIVNEIMIIVEALDSHASSNPDQSLTEATHNQSTSKLLSNVINSSQESNLLHTTPMLIAGQNRSPSPVKMLPVYPINTSSGTPFRQPHGMSTSAIVTPCETIRTVSSTADGTLLAITLPMRETLMGESASGSPLMSSADAEPRTRGQKRRQDCDEFHTKRIREQDNSENVIDFEDGNELDEMKIDEMKIDEMKIDKMKIDQEILNDNTRIHLIKHETSDPLEEDNERIPEVYLCDLCSDEHSTKDELIKHFQQEHSNSVVNSDSANSTEKSTDESQLKDKKKKNDSYYKRKRNCCLYCEKIFTRVQNHVTGVHRKEEEVKQYLIACNRETRRKLMKTIINKGNYEYNKRMIANGQTNHVIPKKYPHKGKHMADRTSHVVCKNCFGTYSLKNADNHYKRCCAGRGNIGKEMTRTLISYNPKKNIQFYTADRPEMSKELKDHVIKHMMKDRVSLVAQSDPLILSFGSKCYSGSKDGREIRNVVNKMREMSKILILMKDRNKDINTFEYCISPQCFNDTIDIVKKLSKRIDGHTFIVRRIQRMGTSLKECATVLKQMINEHVSLLPEEKFVRSKTVDSFIQLMQTKWKEEFCHKIDTSFRMKVSHLSVVPSSDDVIFVFKYNTKMYETLIKKLKNNPTSDNYCVLAKRCIVQLAILNRRKVDEISHALLECYNEKSTIPQFDHTENYVKEFRVVGTSCDDESCLLTKPMIEAINALVASRGVLKVSSKYLFSQPNSAENNEDQVFSGETAVKEVRTRLQRYLKKPENLTSNNIIEHSVSQRTLIETIVPEAHSNDVTMAFEFISKSYEQLIKELEANSTPERYCVLAKRCIAHLIILNRCKQTKITEVLLEGYKQIKETENVPSDNIVQVYNIPAPYHESRSLLLNNQMKLAIDALVASRGLLNITSKYLFAHPNTSELNCDKVFNGEEVINELGQILIFQLKVPDNFTPSGLRYHTVDQEKLLGFTVNGPKIVPVSEDVISLFMALTNHYQPLRKELKVSPSPFKYCELAKSCIAHLIILNKCEPTKVTQTLLEHYERVRKVSVSQSVFSKDAVEVYDFPGSETDTPLLLMSKPMKQAIDTLVVSRHQFGIDSKYLFALPTVYGEDRFFDAELAIDELKKMHIFQIRQPNIFTVDALRNHNVKQDILLGTQLNIGNESILHYETKQANDKAENPVKTVTLKQNIRKSGSVVKQLVLQLKRI